jgi:hypothetical protein
MSNSRKCAWSVGVAAGDSLLTVLIALCGCGSPPTGNDWSDGGGGLAAAPSSEGGGASGGNTDSGVPLGSSSDGGGFLGSSSGGGSSLDGSGAEPCSSIGSTRKCCGRGIQTCQGNEFAAWGPCVDTNGATVACSTPCAGNETTSCDAGVDSPPPDAGCGPGMVCKPGAIRYCDVTGTEWTKSTCQPTGTWGPCVATLAPKGAGCTQASFAPEVCCPPLHLCCQDNPGGPWKDWGGGGCAAVGCP